MELRTALSLALGAALTLGCSEPVPCTTPPPEVETRTLQLDEDLLDLLFMVENAGDLSQEQNALVAQIPELVRALVTGDRDGDGTEDSIPVRSLHIGVVTSDMGTGGHPVPTCDRGTLGNMFGDDGVLITRGSDWVSGCAATYPSVLEYAPGLSDVAQYANDVSCVARAGTGGCGFEQQLEAVLKAVSPSVPQDWTGEGYEPPVFFANTFGHADGANAGFLRADSVLAVVLLTNEEDCSAAEPGIFDADSTEFPGDSLLRCWMHEEQALHSIVRYVGGETGRGGLLGLRRDPSRLVFAAIAGVPVDTVPADGSTPDYAAMLAHPDMQNVLDPDAPDTTPQLRPSCVVPGVGTAYPPRRIVRVAQGLEAGGARTTVQSTCQTNGAGEADYSGAIDAIVEKIADALGGTCLPWEHEVDEEGLLDCDLLEILPADTEVRCADLPGRRDYGVRTVGGEERIACEVEQLDLAGFAAGMPGWLYERAEQPAPASDIVATCGPEGQRIRTSFVVDRAADLVLQCPSQPPECR